MKRILIADDEKSLRMLVAGTLAIGNFTVIETDNGTDALKKTKQEKPDLVILDVMMPGMTGYEVCQEIKSNDQLENIKVIILTAKDQQSDKKTDQAVRADYYVSKPFSPAELLSMVENILS